MKYNRIFQMSELDIYKTVAEMYSKYWEAEAQRIEAENNKLRYILKYRSVDKETTKTEKG
jgi:hypothetical protein